MRSNRVIEGDKEDRIIGRGYEKTELALTLLSLVIRRAISIRKDGYCIEDVDEST